MALEKIRSYFVIFSLLLIGSCTPGSATNEEPINHDEIIQETFERFELEAPYPPVYIESPNHEFLSGTTVGRAVRYSTGREEIYLEDHAVRSERSFKELLEHEVAHLKTWRVHGEGVASHGSEFRNICNQYAQNRKACSESTSRFF